MKQTIQKLLKNETFIAILLIFLTTVLTYGLEIPKLGFYYDDWYLLWSGQSRGAASLVSLFSTDRPFMGVVYSVIYRFLGDTIINWHLYALLWRFIGGLAFFWILRLIWPNQKYLTTLMTVLFMVYPGFLSQPNAGTKQNHLYGFGTALLSIAFMLQAIKTGNMAWKIVCSLLSVVLAVNYLFVYEYMIGLEGMRLILLGLILYQMGNTKFIPLAKETSKRWWPYVLVAAGFLYWRLFIFVGTRNATDVSKLTGNYLNDMRHMVIRLVLETGKDFLGTSMFAWFVHPYQLLSEALYSNLGVALLTAGVVIALVLLYLFLIKRWWGVDYDQEEKPNPIKEFIWLGAIIIVCAIVPVIVSGRNVDLADAYKSYGLHPIGGVVLFVTGIVLLLPPKSRQWALIALIGISVTTQVLNADYWEKLWVYERGTWWQLSWRAPDIKDDSMVMAYFPPGYRLQQDYETWGPVNLIYRPGAATTPAIQAEVLNGDTAYDILKRDVRFNHDRDIGIRRDFNNLLLISFPSPSSCMHVIDGSLPVYSESETLLIQQVGGYSHVDRIVPSGTAPIPPAQIFGSEPAHDWCYYYQKASLARQMGDWREVGRLYDQVLDLNLEAGDASELIPFFEGLVNLGRYDDAKALYQKEIKGREKLRFPLCTFLAKDPGYPPEFHYDYQMIFTILCNS
jgi:hypothetical protein